MLRAGRVYSVRDLFAEVGLVPDELLARFPTVTRRPDARMGRPDGTVLTITGRWLVTTRPDPVRGGGRVEAWIRR